MGIDPNETDDNVSEEEIRMMVDAGSEKGTIDHQEKEFIQNVFEFNDIMAGGIATHRFRHEVGGVHRFFKHLFFGSVGYAEVVLGVEYAYHVIR